MSTQPQLVILFADTPIGRATLTAAGILKLARVGVGQREAGSMDPAALAAAVRAAAPAGVSHLLIAVDGDPCDLEVTEEGIDLLTGYMTRQIELLGELGTQLQGGSATFMASRGLLTRPELREWFDAGLTHVEASLKAYDVKVNMLVPGIPEESAAAWLLRIVAPAVAGHIVIPDEHDTLVTPVAAGIDLVAEERTAQVAALEEIAVTRESAAARGELVALREQQANLSGELSQLGTLLAARRAERAEAEDRINELVHQQATVRRDISEAQELLSDLAGRRAEAAALLGEAREHMLAATGERDALRLDLETSETSRRELEQELAMLRQESDTLRRDVSHVATEHATTSAEVTRDSGHLLQLRQQIEAAQTELERTRTESSNARDGAESAVADMLRRIEQLRGEEDISRQGMLQAQQMVQDARGELTELRRQEGLANEELSRIQSAQEVTMISLRELGGETTGVRAELDVLQRALANTESARTRADRAVAGAIEDAALASARRQDAEQRETDAREARTRLEEEVTGLEWRRKVVSDELTSATEDLVASKAAANAGRDLAAQLSEHAAATRSETDEAEITLRQVQSQLASAELGLTQATSKADALRSHSVAEATSRIAVAETEATRAADEIREAALADIAASQTELEGMRAALTGELTAREVQARLLAEQVVTDASAAAARIRDRVQLQSTEILEEARTHAADIRAEATSLLESAQLQARKVETSQLEAAGVAAAAVPGLVAEAGADGRLCRARPRLGAAAAAADQVDGAQGRGLSRPALPGAHRNLADVQPPPPVPQPERQPRQQRPQRRLVLVQPVERDARQGLKVAGMLRPEMARPSRHGAGEAGFPRELELPRPG